MTRKVKLGFMQSEGIGVLLAPIWPVENFNEKSFVHGWLLKVVQALHPVTLMAIAHLSRQIFCGCAVHTQCCSTGYLLGHSLHLAAQHILQCSICCSLSLFQRCAFLHIKMQKCSFLSHQLLIAIIKRDMQAQQRQGWAQQHLGQSRRLAGSWKDPICLTAGGWTSLSMRNVSCAYLSRQDLAQQWDHPDSTAAQVMQQPHSLRLLQWNLSNADRRTKADQGNNLG